MTSAGPDTPAAVDTPLVVEPLDPARVRRVIWVVLLVLAALQAWNARFTATPDGVSYLDLSDAIVGGHPRDIVNAYWSPLYPALIGLLRVVFRPGGYWEFPLVHALNFLLFAGSIAAFEYFLAALASAAAGLGQHGLHTTTGRVIAYVIFGVLSLMMTPLSLPTPDLLVTSASLVAFGALLRLRDEPRVRRHAIVLGVALAAGALSKSFFVPWSLVVFGVLWLATRGVGPRPTTVAAGVWLVVLAPWCAVLSAHQGRFTVGDTGRLTYIWNINQLESPSLKIMPHGSTTPATDSVLAGVAVTPDARGTNPVWFDPARWYTGLRAAWAPAKQLEVFSGLATQFFSSLGPILLVVWFAFAVATRVDRIRWVRALWIVVLPALVAMGAYSMVLVTTRYIAPFIIVVTLAVGFALPWPERITPARIALGLVVPIMIMAVTRGDNLILAFTNSTLAAVLFGWSFHRRGAAAQVTAAVLGGVSVWILLPRELHSFATTAAFLLVVFYWIAARQAVRSGTDVEFSRAMHRGLIAANAAVIALVFALKYNGSIAAPQVIAGESNANWLQSEAMRQAGFGPGSRVAVIGSPFEAYWARAGRMQIVGVVPPWRVADFMNLPAAKREVLYREFARAGARAVVSQTPNPPVAGDSTWVPHEYIGWIKRLPGG